MISFVDLPGVEGRLDGELCSSVPQMMRRLSKSRVVFAAGGEGCVTAWIDDTGKYRACFQRHMSTLAQAEANTKAELRPFLSHWLPAMRDVHSLSAALKESA